MSMKSAFCMPVSGGHHATCLKSASVMRRLPVTHSWTIEFFLCSAWFPASWSDSFGSTDFHPGAGAIVVDHHFDHVGQY
jgi:hypothetical protein